MKLLTFNVNSIRAREKVVRDLFYYKSIDIACLQEIKVVNEQFPKIHPEYLCLVHGQKQYHGVATCYRRLLKLEDSQIGFPGEEGESRFVYSKIEGWHIINIYAPLGDKYGPRFKYKMRFYDQLREFLQKFDLERERVVLCGDFNIAYTEKDVWDPAKWEGEPVFLPEEREQFRRLLEMGFTDIIRLATNASIFTFYDYREGAVYAGQGLRLDYVLVSKPVVNLTKGIKVLLNLRKRRKPTPSDHVPIVVEFRDA
ncbi:MAG: exodeoxyribonuclease III [Campylobacterales bacterium]